MQADLYHTDYGDKAAFVAKYISELTALDGITLLDSNLDVGSEEKPYFTLSVYGVFAVRFTRDFKKSANSYGPAINVYHLSTYNESLSGITALTGYNIGWGYCGYTQTDFRSLKTYIYSNNAVQVIEFAKDTASRATTGKIQLLKLTTGNIVLYSAAITTGSQFAIDTPLYKQGDITTKYLAQKRINYADATGKVQIIGSKALTNYTNNVFAMEIPEVKDCTTVYRSSFIIIDGKKYYALDTNSLMEVID